MQSKLRWLILVRGRNRNQQYEALLVSEPDKDPLSYGSGLPGGGAG